MSPADAPAAYCPRCDHLLTNDDVVKIVGRHMDGVDPTFECPVCGAEIEHPSRAPDDAEVYESDGREGRGAMTATSGSGRDGVASDAGGRTIAEGTPPLDVTDVRVGDRITVHYDAPGRTALQTAVGTVSGIADGLAFETDTRRRRRLDPSTGVLSGPDDRLGIASEVRVTR